MNFRFLLISCILTFPSIFSLHLVYGNSFSDTTNIISYKDKLGLHIYSIQKFRTYELKNSRLGTKLKFEPNGQTNLGLGFNYKWMGLGLAFSMPFMNKDNDIYGETSRFDLQLNLFSRFYGINAYYQNYSGFYLSNPNDFSTWNEPHFPALSDLQSTSTGISAFYWFNNKRFSYKSAFVRNEFQTKSAGGLLIGFYADYDLVYAPDGFIPDELSDSLINIFDFKGYSTFVAGISMGYGYTFVFFKHLFLNLTLSPGIGYRNLTVWHIIENDKVKPDFTGSLKAKFALGFNTKRLYLGASSIIGAESFKYEEVDISSTSGQLRIYIGLRI